MTLAAMATEAAMMAVVHAVTKDERRNDVTLTTEAVTMVTTAVTIAMATVMVAMKTVMTTVVHDINGVNKTEDSEIILTVWTTAAARHCPMLVEGNSLMAQHNRE